MNIQEAIKRMLQNEVLVTEDGPDGAKRFWQVCGLTGGDLYISFNSHCPSDCFWQQEAELPKEGWRLATPEEEASL